MKSALEEVLMEQLRQSKSSINDLSEFQAVCHRLLANQVLYSEHSNIERDLYFIFNQLEGPIAEYFSLLNFTVYHDENAGYVMLFGPGFNGPRIEHSDDPVMAGLKRKLSVEAVCLVLVLRQAYEDALRSGAGFDEFGCASVSVHQINTLYGTLLGRKAPVSLERRDAFVEVKSLRLIVSKKDDWDDRDGWIKITPVINSLAYSRLIRNIDEKIPELAELDNEETSDSDKAADAAEDEQLLSDNASAHSLFGE